MDENQNNDMMDEELGVDLSDILGGAEADADGGSQAEDAAAEGGQEQEASEPESAAGEPAAAEELFELKFNKESRKVNRQEMTELAQKGLNHDRMRQQRDTVQQEFDRYKAENAAVLAELDAAAKETGMDAMGFLAAMRENMLVNQGLSRDTAKERIRADRAERQLADGRAKEQAVRQQADAVRARQAQDVQEFIRRYPGTDPKSIPQSVWNEVQAGRLLADAYGSHIQKTQAEEIRQLREQLAAREQNDKNRGKTIGSMKTDGKETPRDPFLEALLSD